MKYFCKVGFERVIRAVVKYIRALPKADDYEQLGRDAFGDATDPRVSRLKASVQYYTLCTQEGHAKTKSKSQRKKKLPSIKLPGQHNEESKPKTSESPVESEEKAARRRKKDEHADLVERIALDLDNLELSEVVSAAARAIKVEEESQGRVGPAGDCQSQSNEEGEKDGRGIKNGGAGDGGPTLLEALASGIEVEPAEDGKVGHPQVMLCVTVFT